MSIARDRARAELTPRGALRVGLNLSNYLLINPGTQYEGIAPDLARILASELGVQPQFVPFPSPGPLADAVDQDQWDVAFLADETARAEAIAFSPAYLEIPSTYLVPAGSPLRSVADVDRAGVRIATVTNTAYELFLRRTIRHAQLVQAASLDESFELFQARKLEALSGLRVRLLADQAKLPGSAVLPGGFTSVQQAIGTARRNTAAAAFLADFAERAKANDLVQQAIDRHAVQGVNVAPAQRR